MIPHWLQFGFEAEAKGVTPAWFKQVHGARVENLDGRELSPEAPPEADAGVTRDTDQSIHVFTADCVPVLLWSDVGDRPIAAAHAGWRGTLAGVVRQTVRAMDVNPRTVRAILGPCIGLCCFEVKDDFIAAFANAGRPIEDYLLQRQDRTYCDLVSFIVDKELEALSSGAFDTTRVRCTVCSEPQLPSYRRNGQADPRIRSWIRKTE